MEEPKMRNQRIKDINAQTAAKNSIFFLLTSTHNVSQNDSRAKRFSLFLSANFTYRVVCVSQLSTRPEVSNGACVSQVSIVFTYVDIGLS